MSSARENTPKIKSFLKAFMPQIYVRFSALLFAFNHKEKIFVKKKDHRHQFSDVYHTIQDVIRFRLWTVELLSLRFQWLDDENGLWRFSLFGFSVEKEFGERTAFVSYVKKFNWQSIALLMATGLFLAMHYTTLAHPGFIVSMVPFWVLPMALMTWQDILLSYGAFIAVAEISLVLCNMVGRLFQPAKNRMFFGEVFGPLFSYRVLFEFLIVPAVLFDVYPFAMIVMATFLTSLLDIITEPEIIKGAFLSLKWPILSLHAKIVGFVYTDRLLYKEDYGRFHPMFVASELFSVKRFVKSQATTLAQKYRDFILSCNSDISMDSNPVTVEDPFRSVG